MEVILVDANEGTTKLSPREERETELLDLLRKGGFDVPDGATKGFFRNMGFAMENQYVASCAMNVVASQIVVRSAHLAGSRMPKGAAGRLEKRKGILRNAGFSREQIVNLMREIGRLTPKETLKQGEKGRPTK